MKSLNTKLVLSALGIALLATPAFAQSPSQGQDTVAYSQYSGSSYPNGNVHSGSEQSRESGNEFNGGY